MSSTLETWGYTSFRDVLVFGAGLFGLGFAVANVVARAISVSGAAGGVAFGAIASQVAITLVHVMIAWFPAVARGVTRLSNGGLLSDEQVARRAVLFLGAWTTMFLAMLDPVNAVAHVPVLVVLVIVLVMDRHRQAASGRGGKQAIMMEDDATSGEGTFSE